MSFSEQAKTVALAIVHIFETAKPLGDYGAVAVLTDGAGFSVGINQFTHKSGSLAAVLDRFVKLGGTLADNLKAALPDFRAGRNIPARQGDASLKAAIKSLGPDPKWQQAQREVAFENYLKPALDACDGSGFKHPLSLAVIYDSINQGGYASVRNRVSASSANEKAWIAEYCADRKAWLKASKKSIVRSTVYRPNFFLGEIANGNWNLDLPVIVNGHRLTDAILFPNSAAVSQADGGSTVKQVAQATQPPDQPLTPPPPPTEEPNQTVVSVPPVQTETPTDTSLVSKFKTWMAAVPAFLTAGAGGIISWLQGAATEIIVAFFATAGVVAIVFIVTNYKSRQNDKQRTYDAAEKQKERDFELTKLQLQSAMDPNKQTVRLAPPPTAIPDVVNQ